MHDLATVTVTPTLAASTDNVVFTFFTNGTCEGTGSAAGTVALNGANPGVSHPSNNTADLAPSDYAFRASWAGDTNYTGNTSSCENFSVSKGTSTVATTLHRGSSAGEGTPRVVAMGDTVPLGTVMHDLATVTVTPTFAAPTGNVVFTFFTNGTCEGTGSAAGTVALNGANPGVAHPSYNTVALPAALPVFRASWAGDTNYTGNTSSCENF